MAHKNKKKGKTKKKTKGSGETKAEKAAKAAEEKRLSAVAEHKSEAKDAVDPDPPIAALSEEEQADVPPLAPDNESSFRPVGSKDLTSLGERLGVKVLEVNLCVACDTKKSRDQFSYNQWMARNRNDYSPRCRSCVKAGEFRVVDPRRPWVGWPKNPLQILWERGWIDSPQGQQPDKKRYPSERIGKMVLGMPDSKFLLEVFEDAGHYGYGDINEELCCMPGCTVEIKLQACSRCKHARYCCEEHQALHYRSHKDQCMLLAKKQASDS